VKYLYLLTLLLILTPSLYAKEKGNIAYVSDSFKITFRTGPGVDYKIIGFLYSGDVVEVLSSEGQWTKVKPMSSKYNNSTGWVLNRFLMKRKPFKALLDKANKENFKLKETISKLQSQLEEKISQEKILEKQLNDIVHQYKELKNKYEELKKGSSNYLKLRSEYKKAEIHTKNIEYEIAKLKKENDYLKKSQAHRWFLMGAFVLFSGIILGLILGRKQRKKKSLYY